MRIWRAFPKWRPESLTSCADHSLRSAEQKHCRLCQQIRQHRYARGARKEVAFFNRKTAVTAELLKIADAQKVNIRRVVPLVGEKSGLGRLAGEQHSAPHLPVTEIRK